MKLSDFQDRTLLVLVAESHRLIVEDVTQGYPGAGLFIIEPELVGNGEAFLCIAALERKELK